MALKRGRWLEEYVTSPMRFKVMIIYDIICTSVWQKHILKAYVLLTRMHVHSASCILAHVHVQLSTYLWSPRSATGLNGINATECSSLSFKYAMCWPNLLQCVCGSGRVCVDSTIYEAKPTNLAHWQAPGLCTNAIIGTYNCVYNYNAHYSV